MVQLGSFCLLFIIYVCLHYFDFSISARAEESFEAIITHAKACEKPNPPYNKKPTIVTNYSITIVNGKRYLSGITRVIAKTPLLNFNGRTYVVDNAGNRIIKFQVAQVSCRNFFVKSIMMFINQTINTRNCMVEKGVFQWNHVDMNKVSHSVVTWHAPGNLIHQLQLVHRGATLLCDEIYVTIQPQQ